jgi:hypothetical protein
MSTQVQSSSLQLFFKCNPTVGSYMYMYRHTNSLAEMAQKWGKVDFLRRRDVDS